MKKKNSLPVVRCPVCKGELGSAVVWGIKDSSLGRECWHCEKCDVLYPGRYVARMTNMVEP